MKGTNEGCKNERVHLILCEETIPSLFCHVLQLFSRPLPKYRTRTKGKQTRYYDILSSSLSKQHVVGLKTSVLVSNLYF